MKTNKTPIQELIDYYTDLQSETSNMSTKLIIGSFICDLEIRLEKEKKFAFDCYNQGMSDWDNPDDNSFEQFYDKYVSQHKE